MKPHRLLSNEDRKVHTQRFSAQVLHRVRAGMGKNYDLQYSLECDTCTVSKYLRILEARGDITRTSAKNGQLKVSTFVRDSLGLLEKYPLEIVEDKKVEPTIEVHPNGRVYNLLDRIDGWVKHEPRKSERVFVNCSQLWA